MILQDKYYKSLYRIHQNIDGTYCIIENKQIDAFTNSFESLGKIYIGKNKNGWKRKETAEKHLQKLLNKNSFYEFTETPYFNTK